jgi:hypothetical protein
VAVTSRADEELTPLLGGWRWQSLAFVVLEGAVAATLPLWMVAWFRRRWTRQGRLARRAGRGAYAAYLLHPPEAKFVLVAAAGVAAAFTAGWAVTRSAPIARVV